MKISFTNCHFHFKELTGTKTDFLRRFIKGNVDIFSPLMCTLVFLADCKSFKLFKGKFENNSPRYVHVLIS